MKINEGKLPVEVVMYFCVNKIKMGFEGWGKALRNGMGLGKGDNGIVKLSPVVVVSSVSDDSLGLSGCNI